MKTYILKSIILGFILFVSCTKDIDEDFHPSLKDDQKLSQMGKEIEEFAKNKACAGSDDCKTMAMGSKACGGPTSYIIYALSKTDEKQLMEKVKQYTDFQRELNVRYNRVSDCRMEVPPVVDCLNGSCTSI